MENSEENLPANLEKLQISPISAQPRCVANFNPFAPNNAASPATPVAAAGSSTSSSPESVFQSLSLYGAECPSGSCLCNKKKKSQMSTFVQKTSFKRPVLRRSHLGPVSRRVLRAPVLRFRETVAVMRPLDQPSSITSHLASLDLSTSQGKVLGIDPQNMKDFKSIVSIGGGSKKRCKTHCKRCYKYRSTPERHARAQNERNARPKYQCPLCPYWDKRRMWLRIHTLYKYRSTPERHARAQTERNARPKYQCPLCPYWDKRRMWLRIHTLYKHSVSLSELDGRAGRNSGALSQSIVKAENS